MEEMEKLQENVLNIIFFCIAVGIGLFAIVNLGDVFNRSPIISISNETHSISTTPESFHLSKMIDSSMTEKNPKIVFGSDVVVMNGITLTKDIDYTIDYNIGLVTIL